MKRLFPYALALLMSSSAFAQDPPPLVEAPPPPAPPVDPYAGAPQDPYGAYPPPPPDAPRPAPPYQPVAPGPYYGNPYGNPYNDPNACNDCMPAPPQRYLVTPPPQPARRDMRGTRLLVGGLVLFGTSWVSAALDAASGTTPVVVVPLGGPIYAAVDYQRNYQHTTYVQLETVLLVFDAAAQTAGLVMAIVGGTMRAHPAQPRAVNVSWAGTGLRGTF